MKQSFKIGLVGLLAASSAAFSAEPSDGWYAGLLGGISYAPAVNLNISPLGISPVVNPLLPTQVFSVGILGNGRVSHRIGGGGDGQVGYRWCKVRFEGELYIGSNPLASFSSNNVAIKRHLTPFQYTTFSNTTFNNTNATGSFLILTPPQITRNAFLKLSGSSTFGAGFFNAFYELYDEDADPSYIPYFGLGIGYARVQTKLNFDNFNNLAGYLQARNYLTSTSSISFTRSAPVGQMIIGLSYFFSDYSSFNIDYRYITTRTLNYGFGQRDRAQVSTVNFGFNYTFNEA